MGIFSDKCDNCGSRVKKRARFCSSCKAAAPKGWIRCGQCRKWVGVESNFCPSCNFPMHPKEVEMIAGNRLQREAGTFLQRFEVDNIKTRVKKQLIVEHGMGAIFMKDGCVNQILDEGTHSISDGFLRDVFCGKSYKSIFLAETGLIVIPFRMSGLRSSEEMEVNFYTEVVFRFDFEKAVDLIENLLKEKRSLSYDDISAAMASEVNRVVVNLCNVTSVDELVKNPDVRYQLQSDFEEALADACGSFGFCIERVAELDFFGPSYQTLREAAADVELETRRLVLERRLLASQSQAKKDSFSSEQEYNTFVALSQHEFQVTTMELAQENALLRQVQQHDIAVKESENTSELADIKLDGDLVREKKRREAALLEAREVADSEVDITRVWQQVKREKREDERHDRKENMRLDHEHLVALLETYSKYTPMQLLAVIEPEKATQLLKMRELEIKEKQVAKDVEVKMLKEIHDAQQKLADEKENLLKEFATRTAHRMDKDIEAMSEIAKNQSYPPTNFSRM